jgi:hypothetical protein
LLPSLHSPKKLSPSESPVPRQRTLGAMFNTFSHLGLHTLDLILESPGVQPSPQLRRGFSAPQVLR